MSGGGIKYKSQFLGLAKSIVHGQEKTFSYFDKLQKKIFPPQLVFQRKQLPYHNKYYQQFDLHGYNQAINRVPNYYVYISGFLSFFLAGYYLAIVQYDQDFRYFMFIRFPEAMNIFEEYTQILSEQAKEIQDEYIGEIPEIHTQSDLYQFKEQVKDKLFDIQQKEKEDQEKRHTLSKSAKEYDNSVQSFDQLFKDQDKIIKKFQHNTDNNDIGSEQRQK